MDERQAIDTVYEGLVSEDSLPVKLRRGDGLDRDMLERVEGALRFLIERWREREVVPKRVAAAFVDLQGSMQWGWERYPEEEQDEIEDAANELVDLAYELFEEPAS